LHQDFDKRLKNWGRWARSHPHFIRCYSLESQYRNRSGQWGEDNPKEIPDKINEKDAVFVWEGVRTLPWVSQSVLKFEFIYPWVDRHIAARKSKLYHIRKFDDAVVYAVFVLSNYLTKF